MPDNGKMIRVPRKGPMNIGAACAIFFQLESENYSFAEKTEAIEMVARMPTHNSISKEKILNAMVWLFDHFDFQA